MSAGAATAPFPYDPQPSTKTLPAMFINRQGEPETQELPAPPDAFPGDDMPFSDRGDSPALAALTRHTEQAALNRLRRALFETGQLIVTTADGVSRVCFAGVGDPDQLFVEMLPRDEPVPLLDFEAPGCLCDLRQAETIVRRIYRGDSSEALAEFLGGRAYAFRHAPEAA